MKGDFTRSTFRPENHYRSVRMQQGRVQLDADWNEQLDITAHIEDTTRIDLIGRCGVPKSDPGFAIAVTPDGTDLTISAGRLYADGILCELEATAVPATEVQAGQVTGTIMVADGREFETPSWIEVFDAAAATPSPALVRITSADPKTKTISFAPALDAATVAALNAAGASPAVRGVTSYTTQPGLPAPDYVVPGNATTPPKLNLSDGTYLAYADVWERHITALDDGLIRESALDGPDTATRAKTICQVRLTQVSGGVTACDELPDVAALIDGNAGPGDRKLTTGRLAARSQPAGATTTPCVIPATAGYRRLENQLYRVEVHKPGPVDTATFVWSRENGSIVTLWTGPTGHPSTTINVSSTGRDAVLGFASGQLVELIDDTLELKGLPGTLEKLTQPPSNQVLTIGSAVDRSHFPLNPKVRRWDSPADATISVPADNDGFLKLEDGVEVRFEDGYYNTGDYWLIPARTPKGDVEWPEDAAGQPVPRGPDGIAHGYCALAVVKAAGGTVSVLEDCRETFPSLTSICAEDICVDEGFCDLPGVRTVQDALDELCEESTLRRHKKHLHGWGIVCGLQVECAPGSPNPNIRNNVTVRQGYAIDCEGNDVWVAQDEIVDLLQKIADHDAADPSHPILSGGKGDACLTIALDSDHATYSLDVEPYDPNWDSTQSLMAGTLLMDFYKECVSPIVDFLKSELFPPGEDAGPANPAYQREAILAGLLAQVLRPGAQTIYISAREDKILHDFYDRLKALLQSKTYCAMFDRARSFPPYQADVGVLDTIFGRGHHIRLRLRPDPQGVREAYTVGPGVNPLRPSTVINRYDLVNRKLLNQTDPIAGAVTVTGSSATGSGAVADVAFSPDGRRIYMIAPTRDNQNTFFRAGDITDTDVNWGDLVMLCGKRLLTLATTAADPAHVYAVGEGTGLYRIDPNAPDTSLPLLTDANNNAIGGFDASGHLLMDHAGMAVATANRSNKQTGTYQRLVVIDVINLTASGIDIPAGSDDIALGAQAGTVYCVVGGGTEQKRVVGFTFAGQDLDASVPLPDTVVRLDAYDGLNILLATLEDADCLATIDLGDEQLLSAAQVPLQVSPVAVAADSRSGFAYALNYVSNTITVIPGAQLMPTYQFPYNDLAAYRAGILEALADLLAGFLQYLKDCLCHHFLVNCPDCSTDDKLYLACISISDGNVFNICNFSRRKYVKSFPTVGYWLSFIPILPFLYWLIKQFCCWVIPEEFSRYRVATFDPTSVGTVKGPKVGPLRTGIVTAQTADIPTRVRIMREQARLATAAGATVVGERLRASALARPVALPGLVNQPVQSATDTLAARGIQAVAAPLESLGMGALGRSLAALVFGIPPESQVTLHEQEGTVRLATLGAPSPGAQIDELSRELTDKTAQIADLQSRLQELETLQQRVTGLEQRLETLAPPTDQGETGSKTTQKKQEKRRKPKPGTPSGE